MEHPALAEERRRHPRVRLKLPVRLRWRGPLGSLVEMAQTLDVSREGLRFLRSHGCEPKTRVWVTIPFDPAEVTAIQPETPARIVRDQESAAGHVLAVHVETLPQKAQLPVIFERRGVPRVCFSVPIFVRSGKIPWPEEAMTEDLSPTGARFETTRRYEVGSRVHAQISFGCWANAGEISGRVVRVEPAVPNGHRPVWNVVLAWDSLQHA